jgi:signal transduction histidine kinase
MGRLRSWLDPEAPSSTAIGVASALVAVTVCTVVIYPLKRVVDVMSLDALYLPPVLFVTAKWGARIGLLCALLSGAAFIFFHVPPAYHFSQVGTEGVMFVAVAAAAVYVATLTQRARTAEERRRQEVASRARVVAAADEERRRVVRDLHDGGQARLVHAVITLKLAHRALLDADTDTGTALVGEALEHAEGANAELRELAHGILPSVLARGGLQAAVAALVSRTSLPVSADVSVQRLPADVEATAYFVVSEALTNVVKHAGAHHAVVSAGVHHGALRVEVRDDGVGGVAALATDGSTGLGGLEDRVSALDGRLVVDSPPGGGTRVYALLPLSGDRPSPGSPRE